MKVIALIGASGTGKSHRAIMVAREHNIEVIIDDGLLIRSSSVLAGVSAKRQATKIAAIKTALFYNTEHAEEVIKELEHLQPKQVLILGTSQLMVNRIAARLNLPKPSKVIEISEIATPEEINKAKLYRKQYGKHVIPAPTVEVKPKVSGTLIEPLKTWFKKRHKGQYHSYTQRLLVDQSVVRPTFNYLGKFYIANNVISDIFTWVVSQQKEIHKVNSVHYQETQDGIVISSDLTGYYGDILHPVAQKVQIIARNEIEHMTSLHIAAINVNFKSLVPKEKE